MPPMQNPVLALPAPAQASGSDASPQGSGSRARGLVLRPSNLHISVDPQAARSPAGEPFLPEPPQLPHSLPAGPGSIRPHPTSPPGFTLTTSADWRGGHFSALSVPSSTWQHLEPRGTATKEGKSELSRGRAPEMVPGMSPAHSTCTPDSPSPYLPRQLNWPLTGSLRGPANTVAGVPRAPKGPTWHPVPGWVSTGTSVLTGSSEKQLPSLQPPCTPDPSEFLYMLSLSHPRLTSWAHRDPRQGQ